MAFRSSIVPVGGFSRSSLPLYCSPVIVSLWASTLLDCEQSHFFFSSSSPVWASSGKAARREKRGRQPEKKKRDCPHSQSQGNMRWPHNAKIWLADAWSIDSELSTIEAIDELMMAGALQECLSRFPKIDNLKSRLIVLCETKWNEMKSVVCEMKILTLRNENLYFAKWKPILCEMKICTLRHCEICTSRNENLYKVKHWKLLSPVVTLLQFCRLVLEKAWFFNCFVR